MDIKPILDAAKGVQLALSKFETVLQEANDSNIFAINTAPSTPNTAPSVPAVTPDTPVAPIIPTTPSAPAETSELDDEGVPHDKRIHSEKASLVNSKEVKGGKSWRRKKGIDDATYETIKAEICQSTTTPTVAAPTVPNVPSTPAAPAPSVPGTPSLPGLPSTPAAPIVDESAKIRTECIGVIKQLTDVHGLTFEDCKEILVEEFKVAQNGDQITFGSIKISQYEDVLNYFVNLRGLYEQAEAFITGIREIAGPANQASIDDGLKSILSGYNTEEVGGVHYSQIDDLNVTLSQWHKTYVDWKASQ